jgi:hypothetical protein
MAALDFPSSPTLNQIYTANNKSYKWNGTSWINVATPVEVDPALMILYASLL